MLKERIFNIIIKSIEEFNETASNKINISQGLDTPLFNANGVLDSIGLVNLIVQIEMDIADNLNQSIVIASEKAMSRKSSPFITVGSLTDYIADLIDGGV